LRKLQDLGNSIIYIFLPLIKHVPDLVPLFARSPNRVFSRTTCCSRRRSSPIPVYPFGVHLVILGPRASSEYFCLILSNLVYHPPNSVSGLYCLTQFIAQQSLSLGQNTICDEFGNHLSYPLFIYTYPYRRITPRHFLLDLDLTAQTSLSDGSPPL
jgi:hypothetical protein